jgi:tetratricopeptide (TPR) repeat protein
VFSKTDLEPTGPAILALLFAIHPAHVESVVWISERKDVLSTLFLLLTIWAYIRYARNEGRSSTNFALVILFLALGLLAKPMLVTTPFVLLLLDYWPLERLKKKKDIGPLLIEKIPLFVLTIGSSIMTVLAQNAGGAISSLSYTPISSRIVNTLFSYSKYIWMLFYPTKLGIMYPYVYVYSLWQLLAAILFLAVVTAVCVWQAGKRKYLIVGWLWFLGTLVPVIGIIQVGPQSLADRYTYVPFIGLLIMLIWSASEALEKWRINMRIVIPLLCVIVLFLCAATYKQASYWQNAEELYSHTMEVTENNILIIDNNCLNYIRENRLQEANEKCKPLGGEHNFANAYNTWGVIQVKLENYDEAIRSFQRCVSLNPNHTMAYSNLAIAQSKLGLFRDAAVNLRSADRVNIGDMGPAELGGNYALLAVSFMEQKQPDEAAPLFKRAVELLPTRPGIRTDYGTALSLQGKYEEALNQLNESIQLDPAQAEAYNALGTVFLGQDKKEMAIEQFRKALQLKPDLTSAATNLERTQHAVKRPL